MHRNATSDQPQEERRKRRLHEGSSKNLQGVYNDRAVLSVGWLAALLAGGLDHRRGAHLGRRRDRFAGFQDLSKPPHSRWGGGAAVGLGAVASSLCWLGGSDR